MSILTLGMVGYWWSTHMQFLHATALFVSLLIYAFGAATWDMRERRIPNLWTLSWLGVEFALAYWNGHILPSLLGVILMGCFMLPPTVMGVWGQGDWKMSAVFGATLGLFPSLLVWMFAFMMVPLLKKTTYRISTRYLTDAKARSIPVAVPVSVATILFLLVSMLYI